MTLNHGAGFILVCIKGVWIMKVDLTRGDLAKKCGIHIATIRYYEKYGLLNPPTRSQAGYRLYSEKDTAKIDETIALR